MSVGFHPEASREFQAASTYYENEIPGLGKGFISELERIAELIEANPAIGKPIDDIFRRAVLVRFPFSVIYHAQHDKIWIIAVAHQRRKPGYWRNRTDR
jgi:plasmid stabilization system protein ParE